MGSQIREVLKDEQSEKSLSKVELHDWPAFKWLCTNFLGNAKLSSFWARIEDLLEAYRERWVAAWPSKCIFCIPLKFLSRNLGAVSDKQGKRSHPDIQAMEARYQDFWNEKMMGQLLLDVIS